MVSSIKNFFTFKESEKVLFEVTIRKKSDDHKKVPQRAAGRTSHEKVHHVEPQEVIMDCCRSIPERLPVIPWHTLVLQNEEPPDDDDQAFIRLLVETSGIDLSTELTKFADHVNLRAIFLVSDARVADITIPPNYRIPILIIPLRHYKKLKNFIKSLKTRESEGSVIPLCSAEIKQRSGELYSVCDSERIYKSVITLVRDCIRNNTVMTTADTMISEGTDDARILCFISRKISEIILIYKAHVEIFDVDRLPTDDHMLMITILMERKEFPKHLSQDFPIYVMFGNVLHNCPESSDECKKDYFIKMFQGFLLASIHDIKKGLELFIELLLLETTSIQLDIAENLIELCKHYYLKEPHQAPPVVEIFIIASISIQLFASVNELAKTDGLWKKLIVNVCESHLKAVNEPFLENLKTGLVAMNIILDCYPHFMISWNEYFAMMSLKIYSPCLLKSAIEISVNHMIRRPDDFDFIEKFLEPMMEHVQSFIQSHGLPQYVKQLDMPVIDILKEMLQLLEYLDNLARQQFPSSIDHFTKVIIAFSDIFVSLINFEDGEIVKYVIEITKMENWHQSYLIKEMFKKLSEIECVSSMHRADFVELYQAGNLENQELIRELLRCEENIPQSLCDEGVKVFIDLCCSCLSNHHELEVFLFMIFEKYQFKQQFILDLLSLNFQSNEIFDHLQIDLTNHLTESGNNFVSNIPSLCCNVMDLLPESGKFHARLIQFLLEGFEMHLHSYDSHKYGASCNKLLQKCCSVLQSSTSMGLQEVFSIELLTSAANNLSTLKLEDISWLTDYGETLYQIVKGYDLFKERNESQSTESFQSIKKAVSEAVCCINDLFQKEEVTLQEIVELKDKYYQFSDIFRLFPDNAESIISLDQIDNLMYSHNLRMKTINSLLIRSPWNNQNTFKLQRKETIPVLLFYGLKIPDQLIESIQSHVYLDVESEMDESRYMPNAQRKLKDLKELVKEISELLNPIEQSLDSMVFFTNTAPTCHFFQRLLQQCKNGSETFSNASSERPVLVGPEQLSEFNIIVQTAEKSYMGLLEGKWSFSKVFELMSLEDLKDDQLMESEVFASQSYLRSKFIEAIPSIDSMEDGLRALVTLSDNYMFLNIVYDACKMYQMNTCLEDPKMIELQEIIKIMSDKQFQDDILLLDGVQKVGVIKSFFGTEDIQESPIFQLISTVFESRGLHRFCANREFISTKGYERFEAEYNLASVGMDKEDYCEEILDQLRGAMVFVSPFLNPKSSFSVLMEQLCELINIPAGIRQIEAIERNIRMIDASFNTVEGETHELIMATLKSILKNGKITFCSVSNRQHEEERFALEFPTALPQSQPNHVNAHWLKWNWERLSTFARKLTFLNAEKKGAYVEDEDEDIIFFNKCLNDLKTLLQNYSSLEKLGYNVTTRKFPHKTCCIQWEQIWWQIRYEVEKTTKKLRKLTSNINDARAKCKPLSLISTAKMKILHKIITKKCVVATFIDDLGMFFSRNFDERDREEMKVTLERILSNTSHLLHDYYDISIEESMAILDSTYVEGVAVKFENNDAARDVIDDHPVEKFLDEFLSLEQYQANLVFTEPELCLQKEGFNFNLYTALDYSNMEVVCLIYWIFENRFPYSFQLLRCSSHTCEEDLTLFFQRMDHYPKFLYLILGINKLTMEIQQKLISLCADIKRRLLKNAQSSIMPNVCFVEFKASVFQTLPWMKVQNVDKSEIPNNKVVAEFCQKNFKYRFKSFRIIHGMPGYGKTHFIESQLQSSATEFRMLNIDEAFNERYFIDYLKKFLSQGTRSSALFLNVNLFFSENTKNSFDILADRVNWFFFEYFFLGYVEDYETGQSLKFPDGMETSIFVEVPFWSIGSQSEHSDDVKLEKSFSKFSEFFPAFCLLGKKEKFEAHLKLNQGIMLVCKYLKRKKEGRLDQLLPGNGDPIKFDKDRNISKEECARLLKQTLVEIEHNKLLEKLHWKYLERRCYFMENCPQLMYNSGYWNGKGINTVHMRSTLFEIMLDEVKNLCKTSVHWKNHSQLIYDFINPDASFHFLSYNPSSLSIEKRNKLKRIGVTLTSEMGNQNKQLHEYLSITFGVKLNKDGELDVLMDTKYVLTKDFTLKMLNIHERKECEMPVIIEGETGVGKTCLVEMLSKLWNESWQQHINHQKSIVQDHILSLIADITGCQRQPMDNDINFAKLDSLSIDQWIAVLTIKVKDKIMLFEKLRPKLQFCWHDPNLICLDLEFPSEDPNYDLVSSRKLWEWLELYDKQPSPSYLAYILYFIFHGQLKSCFYKLNLHAAVTPKKILEFFEEILPFAESILRKQEAKDSPIKYHQPTITVFLDEINTSTCPGFLKQIIVDHTLNHRKMPENIFIIAACNPYRGNSQLLSIATECADNPNNHGDWFKTSYYVQPLAPSLELLKWDYGFLKDGDEDESEEQADESEYVKEKMRLNYYHDHMLGDFERSTSQSFKVSQELEFLSKLILKCQNFIRLCASEQLKSSLGEKLARQYATSCVSQRDVQRVFVIYDWLISWFKYNHQYDDDEFTSKVRAICVSIGIVYHFRLDLHHREKLKKEMDKSCALLGNEIKLMFSEALSSELDFMISKFTLPPQISPTQALKENIYATVVCILNHIPLIIVGPPGSSKTLSFDIVRSHLKGQNSFSDFFKDEEMFPPVDIHSYQCSSRSTSTEIESVFKTAVRRKKLMDDVDIKSCAVVLMDEAGLAEERHESLKILHYYLDNRELKLSFVALSNHILDAAKTNRAISLYHSPSDLADIKMIAENLFPNNETLTIGNNSVNLHIFIQQFLNFYENTKAFQKLYGIRDVVHFLLYLYRRKDFLSQDTKIIVDALERNFNGNKDILDGLVQAACQKMAVESCDITRNKDFVVFKNSLADRPPDLSVENQVRYKLVIDSSQDESLIGMFFAFNILDRQATNVLVCTKFPGDLDYEKINTVAALRYSAANGRVVALISCEEIQESFYDIFNQNFSSVELQKGTKYFGNITIGAKMKMCFVDPEFQCVVFLKESKLKTTPAPFLNRFEKYKLTHNSILEEKLMLIPKRIKDLIKIVQCEIENMVERFNQDFCFGFCESTIDSLILSILACESYSVKCSTLETDLNEDSKLSCLLKQIIICLTEEHPHLFYFEVDYSTFDDDVNFIDTVLRKKKGLYNTLDVIGLDQIAKVVSESFKWLRSEDEEINHHNMDKAELVSFCIKEWLQLYICKKLLCITKPEALVHNCTPYEKTVYLKQQYHFSLSNLISSTLKKYDQDQQSVSASIAGSKPNPKCTIKKSIYHTRSTYLVQQILPLYHTWQEDNLNEEIIKEKFEMFFKSKIEIDCIWVCSITLASTSSDIHYKLKNFLTDENASVFLLIVEMKAVDSEVVNHIRIMINELEYRLSNRIKTTKVLSLLLHYPIGTSTSSLYVYPTIYLHDWDHFYLDDIETSSVKGNIDVVEWLSQCCLMNDVRSTTPFVHEETLDYWIEENLPIISLFITIKPDPFECWSSEIKEAKDLWKNFLSEDIRTVLRQRFISYWTRDEIRSTSNDAAVHCRMKRLSLSLIDSINKQVKEAFSDYLMYFLSLMNDHYGVYIMFLNDVPQDHSKKLFINLLQTTPLPKTIYQFKIALHDSEKEVQSYNLNQRSRQVLPQFPFFKLIFDLLEHILDETMYMVHEKFRTTKKSPQLTADDVRNAWVRKRHIHDSAIEQMTAKILLEAKTCLSLDAVLKEMKECTILWDKYLNSAILRRTNVEGTGSQLLSNYFSTKHKMNADMDNMENRLSLLHVNLRLDDMYSYGNDVIFLVHCIDELSLLYNDDDKYFGELFAFVFVKNEDLEDFVVFISKAIESAFTVLCSLLNADHVNFEKLSHFLNVYDRIVIWIKSKEIVCRLQSKTINIFILMTMFFKIVYFSAFLRLNTEQDILETIIGESTCTLKVFFSSYHDFISQKANEDSVMKLFDIVVDVIKILFGDTNVPALLLSQRGSLPAAAFHSLDFLLNFYIVETGLAYFDEDSFYWFLELCSNKHCNMKLSGILINYLHQILLKGSNKEKALPLGICNKDYREKLSSYFLRNSQSTSINYMPIYYKNCPKIKQPKNMNHFSDILADVYFQLIIQQLMMSNDEFSFLSLSSNYEMLTNSIENSKDKGEHIVASIEREAVVNVACTKLAMMIVEKNDLQLETVTMHLCEVNDMLNAEHLSIVTADKIHGHGILFVLRLLQAYNSPNLLCHHMLNNFDLKFEPFDCLRPVKGFMQPVDVHSALPLLAFAQKIHGKKSYNVYQEISTCIKNIVNSQSERTESLHKLASQWCIRHSADEAKSEQDKRLFMMMLFLSIYDILFKKKNTCECLANYIHENFTQYLPNEYISLMVWFTDQGYFKKNFLQHTQSFHDAEKCLIKLRNERNTCLLEFLIQILAITIGSSKSTHLWLLLFAPTNIKTPFPTLPGNVEHFHSSDTFTSFGNLAYIDRSSFNYQSFAMMYTVNYSALALSFLAKHTLMSVLEKTFEFFIDNVKKMWNSQLSRVLYVNQDEKDEIMNNFLFEFYKTAASCSTASDKIVVSSCHEDVVEYEKTMHQFFVSVWGNRKINLRYTKQCKSSVAETLRNLELKMLSVQFDENIIQNSFLHKILSSTDTNNPSNPLYILYQVLLNRCTLNMRGRLLPHLIYTYNFIHDRWSYLLTEEEAGDKDMKQFLDDYMSECSVDSKDCVAMSRLTELTTEYSEYAKISGAGPFPSKVAELVTYGRNDGFLYEMICAIVQDYNSFIGKVIVNDRSEIHKLYLTHKSLRPLPLSEITSNTCCIGESLRLDDLSDLMPVILKHLVVLPKFSPPKELDQTVLLNYMSEYFFDLEQIQFEVMYILSQKELVDLGAFKRNFKFLGSEEQQLARLNNRSGSMDLMRQYLNNHSEYMVSLPTGIKTDFFALFHSLHYNAMQKVLTGLCLLVQRLSQVLYHEVSDVYSVKDFISKHLSSCDGNKNGNFLEVVGIEKYSPTHVDSGIKYEQYLYLCELQMNHVYSIIELLTNWINVELYHYRNLPCSMKAELGPALAQEICDRIKYIKEDSKVITQRLLDLLLENETNIRHLIYQNTEIPLGKAFKHVEICKGIFIDELLDGLQIRHYVYVIIQLKSILGDFLSSSVSSVSPMVEVPDQSPATSKDSLKTQVSSDLPSNVEGDLLPMSFELSEAEKKEMEVEADSISDDEFQSFIVSVGLTPETINLISEYGVTAAVLYEAINDNNQLTELGIDKAYLQLKLRVLFKRFLVGKTSKIAQVFTCDRVIEFIQKYKQLSGFAKVFMELEIDGEMLLLANDKELTELGITGLRQNSLKTNFKREVKLANIE